MSVGGSWGLCDTTALASVGLMACVACVDLMICHAGVFGLNIPIAPVVQHTVVCWGFTTGLRETGVVKAMSWF